MNDRIKLLILGIMAALLITLFLFNDLGGSWDYIFPRRVKKILAIILTGATIAFSTVLFQTITNNKILTPSIIGLDSLYLLIQTLLIFLFGSIKVTGLNQNLQFMLSVGLMVIFASILYQLLFKRGHKNLYLLLLVGLIFGTFFSSISSFMQMIIDPNEFLIVQDRMFASFNNVKTDLLTIAFIAITLIYVYFHRFMKYLDVLSLGREHGINLGVDHDYVVKRIFIVIAILVSIATALVGPITFLGLLVANITYQFLKTYQHKYVLVGAILISIIALVGGQLIVERVFTFSTTLSVIINFIGGVYFIYLLLKENKAW